MKYPTLLLLALSLSATAKPADTENPVKSTIKEVTVFLNGAEINRAGNTTLNTGTTFLLFDDLSPNIDKNSIQVEGKGNFTILSVVHRINYLKEKEKPKEIITLEDSLESLNMKLEFQQNLQKVYSEEESMLLANKSIGNKEVGVDAVDLEEVADLFRKRLTDIKSMSLKAKTEEKKLNQEIVKLKKQLTTLNAKRNRSTSEIIVGVSAKERTPAKFSLSYFVYDAGWTPCYDLRAVDAKSPVKLNYKAKVYQNTGVDWGNVNITLSTVNPTQSGTKPLLSPWVLRYSQPVILGTRARTQAPRQEAAPMGVYMEELAREEEEMPVAETSADYTQVTENQINIEFKIGIPYSIPADGKKHTVDIQNYHLPALFSYYSAPKLDRDAFLLAKVTGWEDYNLLPGNASIYFEGTYIGKSYINTRNINDTLDLSFGRDKSIVITREKLKDFTSKKFIGINKKETYAYEISIRNTKKDPIEIVFDDQVPLSSDKEIIVELLESSDAKYNEETGKLSWTIKLSPAETKKFRLMYSVKYPKDKIISNL
ncbi:MAG: mucoidy inhibitor MuiA family protein [Bacteroidota bacterium]